MIVLEPLFATVHRDAAGTLTYAFNFDPAEPLPWGREVQVTWCVNCFPGDGTHTIDELQDLHDRMASALAPAHDRHRIELLADGGKTLDRDAVLKVIDRSNSGLDLLIKADRFPRPLWNGKARVWLESEVLFARARIVATDTAKGGLHQRPVNRHEKRRVGKA